MSDVLRLRITALGEARRFSKVVILGDRDVLLKVAVNGRIEADEFAE